MTSQGSWSCTCTGLFLHQGRKIPDLDAFLLPTGCQGLAIRAKGQTSNPAWIRDELEDVPEAGMVVEEVGSTRKKRMASQKGR
jgi:hypothetical protein